MQNCCRFWGVRVTVSIVCMNEFIEMSSRCLVAWVLQKVQSPPLTRQHTHFLCSVTRVSGCHLCLICEHSYLTIYKISSMKLVADTSVSHVKVL